MAQQDHKLPRSLKDYIGYYWRFDPKRWALFLVQDMFHFTRYAMAFLLVGRAVDLLIGAEPSQGVPAEAWLCAAGIFAVLLFGEAMHIWTAYIIRWWKPRLRMKIRADFFSYLLGHSHAYFHNNFAGALARKVTEIAESSVRLHDHLRFAIFGSLIMMTSASIALFTISPWYGILIVLYIASIILPVILRLKRIGMRAREFSEVRAHVTGMIVDTLTNISSMRNFARLPFEEMMHGRQSEREKDADGRRLLTLIQIENYRRLCLVMLGAGMMVALLVGWRAGVVSVGEISAVMGLAFSLTGATWMLGFGIVMAADELGYIDDAIRMVTVPHEITDKKDALALDKVGGHIQFENVDFSFGERNIFHHLNLDIAQGERVGLLGPSGAGKSTLVNILLRLYDLDAGRILVDGHDIADVTQSSLRANIAVIPQDTALFHRTLADNIGYGCLDASREDIIEAAKKAYAHHFICELPDGYDTEVGERGVKLSGGQRQRIAIARAILKNAPILILDEATSALDSESEYLIQQSLGELMKGRTVIAIAHRLSTIAGLDRLIVMEQGRIVEEGAHATLIAQGGAYARLWNMQSGGFLGDLALDAPAKHPLV